MSEKAQKLKKLLDEYLFLINSTKRDLPDYLMDLVFRDESRRSYLHYEILSTLNIDRKTWNSIFEHVDNLTTKKVLELK